MALRRLRRTAFRARGESFHGMKIYGFQKLTLLDFPGKTACTVFTGGCNLRCPFCHNPGLVRGVSGETVSEEEVFATLEKRKKTLDGVCITGGEPMLQKDLPEFAEKVKSRGFAVKVDTNGFYPRPLRYLVREGLVDYVAVDVKNTFEKYPETTGRPGIDLAPLAETLEFLKENPVPHEFRTTVCKTFHTEEDLIAIAALLGEGQSYYLQAFRDTGELLGEGVTGYLPSEMKALFEAVKRVHPETGLRGIS